MDSGASLMFVMNLDRAVDGGVIHDAARKWFIGVGAKIEVDAEAGGDLGQIVLGRLHRREASRAFEAVLPGVKPA